MLGADVPGKEGGRGGRVGRVREEGRREGGRVSGWSEGGRGQSPLIRAFCDTILLGGSLELFTRAVFPRSQETR